MQPKVSIVIPCYNKVKYISGMFDSILTQKWNNIELILVNDGSTDTTRVVISEYIPKFHSRGFETVVISQENKGVAAAVYEGLKRTTGDFICQVDADDELDPEYVSELAGHLEKNEACDWVACDTDIAVFDENSNPLLKSGCAEQVYGELRCPLTESFILRWIGSYVCIYMFRKSYMVSCRTMEFFITESQATQEPQIFFSLAQGGASPFYIHKPLYRYIKRRDSITSSQNSYEKASNYINGYNRLVKETLSHVTNNELLHGGVLQVGLLIHEHRHLSIYSQYSEEKQTEKLVQIINESGLIEKKICYAEAIKSGFEPLARYFSTLVIGYKPTHTYIKRNPDGRIIAYAAFGKAAKQARYGLLNSDIRPDIFWDIAAKPEDSIDGIPVMLPDFESLREDDIFLVLLKDVVVAKLVNEKLTNKLPKNNIFYFYDVIDCLAVYFYGKKYSEG